MRPLASMTQKCLCHVCGNRFELPGTVFLSGIFREIDGQRHMITTCSEIRADGKRHLVHSHAEIRASYLATQCGGGMTGPIPGPQIGQVYSYSAIRDPLKVVLVGAESLTLDWAGVPVELTLDRFRQLVDGEIFVKAERS